MDKPFQPQYATLGPTITAIDCAAVIASQWRSNLVKGHPKKITTAWPCDDGGINGLSKTLQQFPKELTHK